MSTEKEVFEKVIEDGRFCIIGGASDEHIEEFSRNNLLKSDNDSYGRRNAIMSFYPGKIDGEMIRCEYDHMLITGRVGSGKTVFVENLINQLILRYADWQVNLNVWDGKCCDFVNAKRGAEFVDVHGVSTMASECSLVYYLRQRVSCLRARLDLLEIMGFDNVEDCNKSREKSGTNLPYQVIFIEEAAVGLNVREELKNEILSLIAELLENGKKAGIYVILSMQPDDLLTHFCNNYFKNNGYLIATRLDESNSIKLFGSACATDDVVGKYGRAAMRYPDKFIKLIDVPCYSGKVMRDICNGVTLPMGRKFSKYKLEQLKKMNYGLGEI